MWYRSVFLRVLLASLFLLFLPNADANSATMTMPLADVRPGEGDLSSVQSTTSQRAIPGSSASVQPRRQPLPEDRRTRETLQSGAPQAQRVTSTPQSRMALIIGNTAYRQARLLNPVNDATDMAATLNRLGFAVTLLRDADQRTMESAIHTFSRQLRQGGVGLFYFAGHGIQVEGENYLIPIGANLEKETDVRYEAVHVGRVLDGMEDAGNDLNIVILDSCRNNPFARSWRSNRY